MNIADTIQLLGAAPSIAGRTLEISDSPIPALERCLLCLESDAEVLFQKLSDPVMVLMNWIYVEIAHPRRSQKGLTYFASETIKSLLRSVFKADP